MTEYQTTRISYILPNRYLSICKENRECKVFDALVISEAARFDLEGILRCKNFDNAKSSDDEIFPFEMVSMPRCRFILRIFQIVPNLLILIYLVL